MPQPRRYADDAAKQRAYRARQAQARQEELRAKGLPPSAPLPTMPSRARWDGLVEQARQALELARDEMQTYYDDRSAAWQASERAAACLEYLDQLQAVLDDLDGLPSW
jgi:hypothetical protein